MKQITSEEVAALSDIIKVALSKQETENIKDYINDILANAKNLMNIDTEYIQPFFNPLEGSTPVREDIVKKSLTQAEALQAAKYKEHGHFKVPKTIDG